MAETESLLSTCCTNRQSPIRSWSYITSRQTHHHIKTYLHDMVGKIAHFASKQLLTTLSQYTNYCFPFCTAISEYNKNKKNQYIHEVI